MSQFGPRVLLVTAVLVLAPPTAAHCADADSAYFRAIDLWEQGDIVGAVTGFQAVLALDPTLHQARLRLAECYHEMGMDADALRELKTYVEADIPGAEMGRAQMLILACGGDPGELLPEDAAVQADTEPVAGVAPASAWTAMNLDLGLHLGRFTGHPGLTAVGPMLEVRWLPWRYLALGARCWLGIGSAPATEGPDQLVTPGLTAAATFPLGTARLDIGAVLPLLWNAGSGSTAPVIGILATAHARMPIPGSRLLLAIHVEAGQLGTPTVGGGIGLGLQIGKRD